MSEKIVWNDKEYKESLSPEQHGKTADQSISGVTAERSGFIVNLPRLPNEVSTLPEQKYFTVNPHPIGEILIEPPLEVDRSIDEQVGCIVSNGMLINCNDAFIKQFDLSGQTDEPNNVMPLPLCFRNSETIRQFVENKYQLNEWHFDYESAPGAIQKFAADWVGVVEHKQLTEIWVTVRRLDKAATPRHDAVQSALDSLGEHIAILDESGNIVAVNEAWRSFARENGAQDERSVGIGANYLEVCGRALINNCEPEAQKVHDGIKSVLSGGETVFTIEYPCATKNGEEWFLLSATPLAAGSGAVISHLNITNRKKLEQEREEFLARMQNAYLEAEAANRIKDEFLATISHELRTPLTSILGWAQMIRAGQVVGKVAEHGLQTIERNAQVQKQLIEDLLDVSRIITGKLRLDAQPTSLPDVVGATIEALEPTAEAKKVRVVTDISLETAPVYADAKRVQQVLWNLLSNAIKFTPKNGEVSVSLQNNESYVELAVSDTGVGIKPEFLPHIFERFRQADGSTTRKHGGLGMGLAIVRHLVELHGGLINAESEGEGHGATFKVRLPIMSLQIDSLKDLENFRGNGTTQGLDVQNESSRLDQVRVLVVDDDHDNLDLLTLLFEKLGASVVVASSVAEAFAEYNRRTPDVVVSDVGMPQTDGYQLMQKIRALPAGKGTVPAIALTAYAKEEDRARALAVGFQDHLKKPVEPAELIRRVLNVLHR